MIIGMLSGEYTDIGELFEEDPLSPSEGLAPWEEVDDDTILWLDLIEQVQEGVTGTGLAELLV